MFRFFFLLIRLDELNKNRNSRSIITQIQYTNLPILYKYNHICNTCQFSFFFYLFKTKCKCLETHFFHSHTYSLEKEDYVLKSMQNLEKKRRKYLQHNAHKKVFE